jgi:hypothetical protein
MSERNSSLDRSAIEEFLEARNKAMLEMDFDFLRNHVGRPMSDEMCELTLHKARYSCTSLPAEARHASAKWLRERGYHGLGGEVILPEGQLPE